MCVCVWGAPSSTTIRQSWLTGCFFLCCTLHASRPIHPWGKSRAARVIDEVRGGSVCAQVNATHRKEGGVSLLASINGRTGISSGSDGFSLRLTVSPPHCQRYGCPTSILNRWRMNWNHVSSPSDSLMSARSPGKVLLALSRTRDMCEMSRSWPHRFRGPSSGPTAAIGNHRGASEINQIPVCYLSNSGLIETWAV